MKNAELWKRIVSHGAEIDDGCDHPDPSSLLSHIATAPIIVAPMGQSLAPSKIRLKEVSGCPLAIPFDEFWIEGMCFDAKAVPGHWGAMVVTDRLDDGAFQTQCMFFQSRHDQRDYVVMAGSINFSCDATGIATLPDQMPCSFASWLKKLGHEIASETLCTHLGETLSVLAILACKNASLSARDAAERSKLACKRHGGNPHPAFRYHVLVIKPPGARSDSQHDEIEVGTMPSHICRGHFKDYSAERPLFGNPKLVGRFYIQQHMRGDKKNGVVEKDYEIRTAV